MKTKLFFTALFTFSFSLSPCFAQVPQGFNYQAIARDGSGNPIINATIKVKLSILSDTTGFYASGNGTYIWEEEHSNVKTNAFGLITIVLGDPAATQTAGSATSFSAINWTVTPLYIGTKIANPVTYKNMGSAKLWSVPYSLVSSNLNGTLSKLDVTGVTTSPDSVLFEVKNMSGQTVFAVYNEGVRIYVDEGVVKGATKGGFAIGSFGTDKAPSTSYFVVNADSIRAYITPNTGKGIKGGFAIGGFDPTKTYAGEEYLRVTRDSTRVYVNESGKASKGGFAIGGFSTDKSMDTVTSFTSLTPDNYFIGQGSGVKNIDGLYNSFLGYKTGSNNVDGSNNVFLGYNAGLTNNGSNNVFLGYQSGYGNTTGGDNVFLGTSSGYINSSGASNVFIGDNCGYNNTFGKQNVILGYYSGYNNYSNYNVFIGCEAGYNNTSGWGNTANGYYALYNNLSGLQNVSNGYQSLYNNTSGSNNIANGVQALYYNTTGHDNIAEGASALYSNEEGNYNTALGSNAFLNGSINSNSTALGANSVVSASNMVRIGDVSVTRIEGQVATSTPSDGKFKDNVTEEVKGLDFITRLRPVLYNSDTKKYDAFLMKNMPDSLRKAIMDRKDYSKSSSIRQTGFIAQEVEAAAKECGYDFNGLHKPENDNDNYSLAYSLFTVPLVKAVQEQQKQIESQQKEIDELKTLINTLVANQISKGNN